MWMVLTMFHEESRMGTGALRAVSPAQPRWHAHKTRGAAPQGASSKQCESGGLRERRQIRRPWLLQGTILSASSPYKGKGSGAAERAGDRWLDSEVRRGGWGLEKESEFRGGPGGCSSMLRSRCQRPQHCGERKGHQTASGNGVHALTGPR